MASLTLSWSHFDVIKWNQKAMLKELKTGWNTHFRQSKNIKIEFFSRAAPLELEGGQRGLQHHLLPNSPPGQLRKFSCLFLIYMFTARKTANSIIFSYFDNGIPTKIKWKMHFIDTLYLKFRRYFLKKFIKLQSPVISFNLYIVLP